LACAHDCRILNHHDPDVASEREAQQVAKITVARDDSCSHLLRSLEHLAIVCAAKSNVANVLSFVSFLSKQVGKLVRKVLVNEETRH
jgi:hypothetical protein